MKIRFVLENGKRRPLANALGEAMNTEVRYLGAPTFCFEAGGCQLDKHGVLEIPEGVDHGLLLEKLTDALKDGESIQKNVKDAVAEGKISKSRYDNYRLMYEELKQKRRY